MAQAYDGTPLQNGTAKPALLGSFGQFSIMGERVCTIIERYFVDDPKNKSKRFVEYDVRDIETGIVYSHVRRKEDACSESSSEEVVLHAATKSIKEGKTFSKRQLSKETDGDLVLVGFIGGVASRGVITGSIATGEFTRGATKADGERRLIYHKGTLQEFLDDGSFTLTRDKTKITIFADGTVQILKDKAFISLEENQVIKIQSELAGSIEVSSEGVKVYGDISAQLAKAEVTSNFILLDGAPTFGVLLGQNAFDSVIRGDTFNSSFMQPLLSATQALSAILITQSALQAPDVNIPVPTQLTAVAVQTLLQAMNSFALILSVITGQFAALSLSQKVKVE